MFLLQVVLIWWVLTGTLLAVAGGVLGFLVYFGGILILIRLTGFSLISVSQFNSLLVAGAGMLALSAAITLGGRAKGTGTSNLLAKGILLGASVTGLTIGMLSRPALGLFATGGISGTGLWLSRKRFLSRKSVLVLAAGTVRFGLLLAGGGLLIWWGLG